MRNRLSHIREQFNAWQTRWRSLRWAEQRLTPGLAAAFCGMALFAAGAWEPVERLVYTGLFAVRDRVNPIEWDDRLVVIAIDEESLATYGTYPWSRERYTDLLNQLMPAQPAAIGFDILMPQSTPQDAPFAESIRFSSNVVLAVGSDAAGKSIQVAPSLLGPTDGFVRIGHIKHRPDADGLSRQAFLYEIHGTNVTSSFGIALLEAYQQSLESLITTEPLDIPNVNPVFVTHRGQFDQDHPVWINWPGSTHSFTSDRTTEAGLTTFSFAQVMAINDSQALAQFQNKIVLVGYTAAGVVGNTEDALRTPFDRQTPTAGVYLHAAVVDNLLRDRFLTRLPLWWTLLLLLASGIGSSLILKPLQVRGRMLVIFGFMPLWFALAYGSFLAGVWIPVAAPVATSVFGLLASQFVEQRERQTLMDLFEINVSPEMADFIWQHKSELLTEGQIRPQKLTATLLFADIRGFTSISEKLPSDVLLPWLNRYFEVMTDCIMAHGGVVDKYIGDAIMAAFGAPIIQPGAAAIQQNAIAAGQASLAMIERLQALNREFAAQGLPAIQFGIGLHTGTLVGGTVGSRHRANYSLFGDTVNVAARLQDLTKTLTLDAEYPILVSEATYQHIHESFNLLEKGQILLRGRTVETTVYTLTAKSLTQHQPNRSSRHFLEQTVGK